jgi:CMP-N-acetylneuraminic acid synthetase
MKKENYIVLIPARKNSKRLKNKNKKLLLNKPLISHSIEYALNYFANDQIWVNSDDHDLKDIAIKYNINFYSRKKELAEDETTTNLVVRDFCQNLTNQEFENIITLQPTNPIRSRYLMIDSIEQYEKSGRNSLMSVSLLHKKFGSLRENIFHPENYKIGQRHQDIENLYYENGQIYISSKNAIINLGNYISEDVFPFITNEIGSQIDIDHAIDFNLAELIMKNQKLL